MSSDSELMRMTIIVIKVMIVVVTTMKTVMVMMVVVITLKTVMVMIVLVTTMKVLMIVITMMVFRARLLRSSECQRRLKPSWGNQEF